MSKVVANGKLVEMCHMTRGACRTWISVEKAHRAHRTTVGDAIFLADDWMGGAPEVCTWFRGYDTMLLGGILREGYCGWLWCGGGCGFGREVYTCI